MARDQFELRAASNALVIEINGDVDITNAIELEQTLNRAAASNHVVMIVSLTHADYFDSKAIQVLFDFIQHLKTTGRRALVVLPQVSTARRLLEFAGLAHVVPVHESIPDALAASTDA